MRAFLIEWSFGACALTVIHLLTPPAEPAGDVLLLLGVAFVVAWRAHFRRDDPPAPQPPTSSGSDA